MISTFTQALLLDRVPYRDRDLVVTLLTRDAGVVSAIAPAARGSRKRFAGALDLFVVFQAELRERPGARLQVLASAAPIKQFPGILDSLDRLEAGQCLTVIARDLLREAPAGRRTFDVMVAGIETIESTPPAEIHGVLIRCCLGLLALFGHAPDTARCPVCGDTLDKGARLLDDGVVMCERCAGVRPGLPVSRALLQTCGSEGLSTGGATREECLAFLAALIASVLGRSYRIQTTTTTA